MAPRCRVFKRKKKKKGRRAPRWARNPLVKGEKGREGTFAGRKKPQRGWPVEGKSVQPKDKTPCGEKRWNARMATYGNARPSRCRRKRQQAEGSFFAGENLRLDLNKTGSEPEAEPQGPKALRAVWPSALPQKNCTPANSCLLKVVR